MIFITRVYFLYSVLSVLLVQSTPSDDAKARDEVHWAAAAIAASDMGQYLLDEVLDEFAETTTAKSEKQSSERFLKIFLPIMCVGIVGAVGAAIAWYKNWSICNKSKSDTQQVRFLAEESNDWNENESDQRATPTASPPKTTEKRLTRQQNIQNQA